MSDIYLMMSDIDSSQLEKASRKLKDAADLLQKAYNAMMSYDSNLFELYDYWTGYVFSESSSSTVYHQKNRLYSLADSLDAAVALCRSGPDAMAEIDASQRKGLAGLWGGVIGGGTYHGSGAMSGRRGAQSRFFASRSGVTGEDTDVSPYQDVVDEFDWGKTTATEEEIDKAVRDGMDKALRAGGAANVTQYVREELKRLYDEKSSAYHKYRTQVDKANSAGVGEKQKNDWCTYASMATMLRRKQALAGEEITFTRDGVREENHSMAYAYDYRANGTTYHVVTDTRPVSSEYMVTLLNEHPEGVWVYDTGYPHAIVITDYEIKEDGQIQFYADDPVNNAKDNYKDGRVPLEETWFYKNGLGCNSSDEFLGTVNRVCYIQ